MPTNVPSAIAPLNSNPISVAGKIRLVWQVRQVWPIRLVRQVRLVWQVRQVRPVRRDRQV
jgi:hypothetical protein